MYKAETQTAFNVDTPEWFEQAACKDAPKAWFFPAFGGQTKEIEQAKKICSTCPVKEKCLKYGKKTRSSGIWGGKTLTLGYARKPKNKKNNNKEKK